MPKIDVKVDTSGFEAACAALAKVTGKGMEAVVTAELGRVLDKTIDLTPMAKANAITRKYNEAEFSAQPTTLYVPTTRAGAHHRNLKAHLTKNGKIIYYLRNRYPQALWASIQAARKQSLARKLGAIGLARKSWWVIAKQLGLPVKGGPFTGAVASTGKSYPGDVSTAKKVDAHGVTIEFVNAQPTVNAPGVNGARALQTAVNGRAQFFATNVSKGVFDSMQNIARQYPGLKLTQE